jgi:hypothetical protein
MAGETLNSGKTVKNHGNWIITTITVIGWVFVLLGFLSAIPAFAQFRKEGFTLDKFSAFGSYLQGAVASLFSLGGLLFIYASFLGQQKQIAQQDQEQEDQKRHFDAQLKLQEAELKDQKARFEAAQDNIKRQNFESSFYQLLNLYGETVSQVRAIGVKHDFGVSSISPQPLQGRECFQEFHRRLSAIYKSPYDYPEEVAKEINTLVSEQHNAASQTAALITSVVAYQNFYNKEGHQEALGHYFRTLYHVFKFIHDSNAFTEYEDKRRYTSLVRAQLSAYELALLFYNGLAPFPAHEANKFKPLIERYGLLEHLDESLLLDKSHNDFYSPSAYK